ncbi:MAG: hypothetical protein RL238_724 [Actinomycetota bacterium]|jgi:hypothetical protein
MFEPNVRTLLLDALRPPPGCTLDYAVGTTFTLDLQSALTVPLALAGYNLGGDPDPLAVMQALRSTANKIDVFAQAGMISARSWPGDLAGLLEPMVHTVGRPKSGHLFHPKLWVLRFIDADEEVSYRCIVASRNLTPDRSWDLMLRLDSEPGPQRVNPHNGGLVALLEALPDLAGGTLPIERRTRVLELAAEVRGVTWECPDGVDSIRFLAFGVRGGLSKVARRETFTGFRHLLIAPFLTSDGVQELLGNSGGTELTVISRQESLDALNAEGAVDGRLLTLNPLAELREDGGEVEADRQLGGLHAKAYIIEAARRAYVYVGSANATGAAFNGNVEVLCELGGGPKALGVRSLLDADSPFLSLLVEYAPSIGEASPERPPVERLLENLLVDIASNQFSLDASQNETGWTGRLLSDWRLPADDRIDALKITFAPFSVPQMTQVSLPGRRVALEFPADAAASLTPFFVATVSGRAEGISGSRSAVIKAEWLIDIPGRLDDLMVRQIDTPEKFLRFVMLLLSFVDDSPTGLDASLGGAGAWHKSPTSIGMFELLVRALATAPAAIDRLDVLVERLRDTNPTVLPAGWNDEFWDAVKKARHLVGTESA